MKVRLRDETYCFSAQIRSGYYLAVIGFAIGLRAGVLDIEIGAVGSEDCC